MTPTFTSTSTATVTPTITPGEGSWNFAPTGVTLVTGTQYNSAVFTYTSGYSAWGANGLLTILFPPGLSAPTAANFYAQPAYASYVNAYGFNGQTAYVDIKNLGPNSPIGFYYGYGPSGFAVNTTISPATFDVYAHPQAIAKGGQVPTPSTLVAVITPSPTPTLTITPTPTISQTFTMSPTSTVSPTITQTYTETPIGAEPVASVYSYPNPFDQKKFDKCTFRFPNAPSAKVTVFNLVGEPVREIPDTDINAPQGWAIWPGVDDYLRKVTGGLYFVRVRTPGGVVVKKFTVLY